MTVQTVKYNSSKLNLALVSNTTHDKRRLCPCQVSQRFVIRTFRHISHLMLTFNGFGAIVYGSHKKQVPSRTFREHSQILTNRVKFINSARLVTSMLFCLWTSRPRLFPGRTSRAINSITALSAGGPSRSIRMARLFNHNWSLSSNSQDESEKKVLRPIFFVTIAI